MKKYVIAILIGVVATVVFGFLAGVGNGACHCNSPLQVLFPYLTLAEGSSEGGTLGGLLLLGQFPAYALSVAMPKRAEWRAGVCLILILVHGLAVALALG